MEIEYDNPKTIMEAVVLFRKAANPVRITLFGFYACGDIKESSDLDFLVIEKEIKLAGWKLCACGMC
ncbi:hypothetical protein METP3_03152 [Methanosarcinales archaeon]|nr:hypothetical protein METP3_03152 [Methanosarcinales archaeon]